jgi:hypothetical protein
MVVPVVWRKPMFDVTAAALLRTIYQDLCHAARQLAEQIGYEAAHMQKSARMRDDIEVICDPRFLGILGLALLPLVLSCGFILLEA